METSDLQRWSRQICLPQLGVAGQERLRRASVLCVGSGALGSPVALYLVAAGIGRLVLVDPDVVEVSNLQRQILHGEAMTGEKKIHSAAARLRDLNPYLQLDLHDQRLSPDNAFQLAAGCDAIVDGSDNFPTRFLTNDLAFFLKIPLFHAAIHQFEGQMTVFHPASGGPCYRCLLPQMPTPGSVPSCAEAGVIGALPGIMGSLQAMEALKWLANIGTPAIGELCCYDALRGRFRHIRLRADPQCALCGTNPRILSLRNPETLASTDCVMESAPTITVTELYQLLQQDPETVLIDVREPEEFAEAAISGSDLIPLATLPEALPRLPRDQTIYVHCKMGGRSARACAFLGENGFTAVNVTGGILAWIEASLPTQSL